jgi:hypothetical protein
MSLILVKHGEEIRVENELTINERFQHEYNEAETDLEKEDYFWEYFFEDPINGSIDYIKSDNIITFKYSNWDTDKTYSHIEWCLEKKLSIMEMFYSLIALRSCGAIGEREYRAIDSFYKSNLQ